MQVRDFETLIAVAEEGSIEATARRLGITAAAVSQRLSRMEDAAGRQFVVRDQPSRLTEAGDAMARAGWQIRLVLEETKLEPDAHPAALRVAVHHDSLAAWFVPAIAGFFKRTGRTIEIITADHTETRNLLRTGQVSAAVSSEPAPLAGCIVARVGRLEYRAVAAANHASNATGDGLPALFFDRQDTPTLLAISRLGLSDAPRSYIPSVHDLHSAVLAGAGWGVMPLPLVAEDLLAGRMIALELAAVLNVDLFLHFWRSSGPTLKILEEEVHKAFRSRAHPPDR